MSGSDSKKPREVMQRLAKAMSNELRARILMELNQRGPMSPSQFFRECVEEGDTESKVYQQFDQLEKYGLAKVVKTLSGGRRRGGVEHFYEALQPAEFDTPAWAVLPPQFKAIFTNSIFRTFVERIARAMDALTIDARNDRHVSWVTVALDEEGWKNIIKRTDSLYHFMRKEETRAAGRMADTGEKPIPTTVGLFVFESPPAELRKGLDE